MGPTEGRNDLAFAPGFSPLAFVASGAEPTEGSVDERNHAELRAFRVLVPKCAVLPTAALFVSPGAVREQHAEPQGEQERDDRAEPGAQGKRGVDHDLARVVELATDAPPARHEQSSADRLGGLAPDRSLRIALELV